MSDASGHVNEAVGSLSKGPSRQAEAEAQQKTVAEAKQKADEQAKQKADEQAKQKGQD